MKSMDNLEEAINKKLNFTANAEMHHRILDDVLKAQEKSKKAKHAPSTVEVSALAKPSIRRIIMKSKITKLATAAAIILIAALSITFLEKTATPAYALDQTIKANHTVRYLHIKVFKNSEDEPKEFWVECNESGQVNSARIHMPEWASPEDGAKEGVWKENKVQIWFKRKNTLFIARDKAVAEYMLKLVEESDPRLAVERLCQQQQQGNVKVEIDEPSDKTKPIIVTATYLPGSSSPNKREVLLVDQTTKLVTSVELYQLKGDTYRYTGKQEYCDYNQPIESKMFTLDEVPADVMRVDQTIQEIGLAQGKLTNEEIAVEVVRQFFEALIVKDYAKAGKLLEGIPADKIGEAFGDRKFLRIISIGPAGPHPVPETKGLVVPCTVEIEKDGKISEWKLDRIGVRQVYNQPGRWTIFGGI